MKLKEYGAKVEKSVENQQISEEAVLDLLFNQVEKPKNYVKIKVTNVFGDNFRINIWSNIEEDGLTKCKITHSYFAKVIDNVLTIKA